LFLLAQDVKCFFKIYMLYLAINDIKAAQPLAAGEALLVIGPGDFRGVILPQAAAENDETLKTSGALLTALDLQAGDVAPPFVVYRFQLVGDYVAAYKAGDISQTTAYVINECAQQARRRLANVSVHTSINKETGVVSHDGSILWNLDFTVALSINNLKTLVENDMAAKNSLDTHNPFRIPAMVANALVIALAAGMLVMFILSLGPVATFGLGIAGIFASGVALFSLLMNFGTNHKAREEKNGATRTFWGIQGDVMLCAGTLVKAIVAVLALLIALGSFGVIPLGALLPILLSAFTIIGMVAAMGTDAKLQLAPFSKG
jgi:hypothetical protein